MKEETYRVRVNRLKKTDPEFYLQMLNWRDKWRENAKSEWMDRPVKRTFQLSNGKLLKRYETFEEVLDGMTKLWYDDGWQDEDLVLR